MNVPSKTILTDRIAPAPVRSSKNVDGSTRRRFLTGLSASCVLAAQFAAAPAANAASATWNGGGGDALWSTATNWSASPVPGTGDTATFSAAAGAGGAVISLGSGVAIKTITFTGTSAAAYTLGSGGVNAQTLTFDPSSNVTLSSNLANSQTINAAVILGSDGSTSTHNVSNSHTTVTRTITFAGTITGGSGGTAGAKTLTFGTTGGVINFNGAISDGGATSLSLTKGNVGGAVLAGASSYTGTTTVTGGSLTIKNATALGSTVGATTVTGDTSGAAGNARLVLDGGITVTGEALTVTGNGAFEGALTCTNTTNTWAGNITLGATGTRIGAGTGGTLIISGVVDSGGNNYGAIFQRNSSGTTVLNGVNTYVGDTQFLAGTVKLGTGDNRLPVATKVTVGSTTTSATFNLNGVNQEIAGLITVGLPTTQVVTNSSGTLSTLTLNTPTATPSIYGGVLSGNLALTKKGSDMLTLSFANTYTGATSVEAGTLLVSGALNGTASVSVTAGATLASGSAGGSISASAATGNAINVAGTLSPGDTALAPITLTLAGTAKLNFDSGSQLRLDVGAANSSDTVTFGGTAGDFLSGSGNVTLALNGTIDYTSTYTVFSNVTTDGFAFAAITGYDTANYVANLTDSGTAYQLSFVAVPEPSALVSLLGGLGLLMGWRRRQA